ncbi:hypothetical protein ACJMK2_007861 [Sinanodonta woodiana]|uniref:BZIP domain-containing protein n=1 Tax=Sinanodonta woodiana TaxID=1069815 RepID=A0ABD3VMU2_SINWO
MYERPNSVFIVTLYMDGRNDCKASAASALPLTLHEFPECTNFSTFDSSVKAAAEKAIQNNDMMPLIKEELKNKIQIKRLSEGKEELMVDFAEKPKAEVTDKEKEKVERRKIQNKVAARKFREKQKRHGTELQKKTQLLESTNTFLRNEIKELKREHDILLKQLQDHMSVCPHSQ